MRKVNTSNETLMVPGVGPIKPGELVDLPDDFHNANFKEVPKGMFPKKRALKPKGLKIKKKRQ